jgi:CheY-like chemotaxis protein
MLESKGYRVDSVSSGELAVEFVKKKQVDLLLLDMLMEPGMNGRKTYEQIRKLYPDQKAVVASGFSESGDVKALLRLGASSFIKKPYTMEQLARAVQTALAG